MSKDSGEMYETFDSAAGPTIPDKAKSDFTHGDSASGMKKVDSSVQQGDVPEVPQKSR